MQICTLTHNHASIPPVSFYRPDALPAANQKHQSIEVSTGMGDHLQVGIPLWYEIKPTTLTQYCILLRLLHQVPALVCWSKGRVAGNTVIPYGT